MTPEIARFPACPAGRIVNASPVAVPADAYTTFDSDGPAHIKRSQFRRPFLRRRGDKDIAPFQRGFPGEIASVTRTVPPDDPFTCAWSTLQNGDTACCIALTDRFIPISPENRLARPTTRRTARQ